MILAFLFVLTIPVTTLALLYARWEYRQRGKLTVLGLGFVCAMLFLPNLMLEYATTYEIPSTLLDYAGVLIGGVGIVLSLISIAVFHSVRKVLCIDAGKLTTAGPYRWSRNPQYVGWFLFLLGFALNDWSLWCLAALLVVGIGLHLLVLVEEEHLLRTFGEQYTEFCRKVPRYVGWWHSNGYLGKSCEIVPTLWSPPAKVAQMRKEPSMYLIQEDMEELRGQLGKGSIQRAYRALLSYMMGLRTHFNNSYAGFAVSGLYQGYMDMTYFALVPPSLKHRGLKIAIVFNHDAFKFEAWLAGSNRKVQWQYWELFKDSQWPEHRVVTPAKGIDSILECDLATDFDLNDSDALTASIEKATVAFIDDIERFLAEHNPPEQAGMRD